MFENLEDYISSLYECCLFIQKNKSYEKSIKYSCPEPGWGYPSNGLSEMYSICQSDKNWNITSLDDCECKY